MDLALGRLGLEEARIPHKSRNGLLWLERGQISVENGCLSFATAGYDDLPAGKYGLPHQTVSAILLGPGTSISHDALRILANHGTALLAIGSGGVRIYSAPPLTPDNSNTARLHCKLWSNSDTKVLVARRMFAWRFKEVFPHKDLDVLRGIEGARVKRMYSALAGQIGIEWNGRRYDRNAPLLADTANQCINHATTALYAAAAIAVYSTGAIPQLGFIHEASGDAFCLDIADLYRMEIAVPCAFRVAKKAVSHPEIDIEKEVRRSMGASMRDNNLIDEMIDRIKALFDDIDSDSDDQR